MFETIVKKQEEIEQLKRDKKALLERLNASHSAIDSASETIAEWFPNEDERGAIYNELIGELAPNEELLRSLEKGK